MIKMVVKQSEKGSTSKIRGLFKGYWELFRYIFSPRIKYLLDFPLNLGSALIILGLIGILRNILEVYFGGAWANQWFALKPDIFFTMFFYPIFLCFFPTTLLSFFSKAFKLKIKTKEIFSVLFFIQILFLIIPFLDGLADRYHLPYYFNIAPEIYIKLIFSPSAFTPLILFFTRPTSFGIEVAWLLVTFILLKLYLRHFKCGLLRSLVSLMATFYLTYMSVYPLYYFFLNESILGSNYMFGLFFMFMSIPSVIYVKSCLEHDN